MDETTRENYMCPVCNKPIEEGQKVTGIMSGSARGICRENKRTQGDISKMYPEALVFHDDCFLSVAGSEFFPPHIFAPN